MENEPENLDVQPRPDGLTALLKLLARLKQQGIHYSLEHNRDDAVMIVIALPTARLEVNQFEGGRIEVEVFPSAGWSDAEEMEKVFDGFVPSASAE